MAMASGHVPRATTAEITTARTPVRTTSGCLSKSYVVLQNEGWWSAKRLYRHIAADHASTMEIGIVTKTRVIPSVMRTPRQICHP